jgi:dipeptidyl aminopeptidase/acylaminoacyl peptidase
MSHILRNIGLTLGLAACSAGAVSQGSQSVPLSAFVRHAEFDSAKISPRGDYLAVTVPKEGRPMLAILDLKQQKMTAGLFWDHDVVQDYWWTSDDRVLVSIGRFGGPLGRPRQTGELYALNADGSDQAYVYGARAGERKVDPLTGGDPSWGHVAVIDPLPEDADSALISSAVTDWFPAARTNIARIGIDAFGGKSIGSIEGVELDAVTDRAGRIRFTHSIDVKRIHRLRAYRTMTDWVAVPHPNGPPAHVELHGATASGSSAWLTTSEEGGRTCLREYRFETSSLVDRACSDSGSVPTPVFALDTAAVVAVQHEADKARLEVIEPKHRDARLLVALQQAFAGHRISVKGQTRDGSKALLLTSSDRNPGDYYLVDRATAKASYLFSTRRWIDPALMAPSQPVTYKTRDGAAIHGYLTATEPNVQKAPLVLLPHDGPHEVRDWWAWDAWSQALASHGYAVLKVNYRGSGGFGYAHEAAGYRKWGTLMQDDLTDAVRWAISEGIADPSRICIMGVGYGAYAALMSSVREPDLYRCAIGLAGMYDLDRYSQESDIAKSYRGRVQRDRSLGDADARRGQSPIAFVGKLKAALLIAHGTNDGEAPFSQATALRAELEKHQKQYEWIPYDGEQHGLAKEANREDFLKRSIEFLDKHIGPATAAR